MKKIALIVVLVVISIGVFGQNVKHSIEFEAGFSMIDEAKGPCLGARYFMELNPYFVLATSLSSSNGFYFDPSDNYHYYTSGYYSACVGAGGQIGFLKRCKLRVLAEGGAAMFAKENVMYLHPSIGGTGEVLVKLNNALEAGVFISKDWMLCNKMVPATVGKVGVTLNFNIN